MANELKERYLKFDIEKLNSILISKRDTYNDEAIKTAKEVLVERGHDVDVKKLYREKFNDYYDDDLVLISEKKEYRKKAHEVITEILESRSINNIDSETEKVSLGELTEQALGYKDTRESKIKGISSTQKVIGIFAFSFVLLSRLVTYRDTMWDLFGVMFSIFALIFLISQKTK